MESKKFWEIIRKGDITGGRRAIKSKWIFKIKRNGIFGARLVAKFQALTSMNFRIMLVSKIIWELQASISNVETAFVSKLH
jgi:hypothetical protein